MRSATKEGTTTDPEFHSAVIGLQRGDFSRLEPLFVDPPSGGDCRIIEWHKAGYFDREPAALAEALTCASFLGRMPVVEYLLARGVDPAAGAGTGLDALHWAANRGQLEAVELLITRSAPLESRSMHGGTALGTAIWSAIHEPRPRHVAIVEALLAAGARTDDIEYPTEHAAVNHALRRAGLGPTPT